MKKGWATLLRRLFKRRCGQEKEFLKYPKPDSWKYIIRYKVYPKPVHRNWCGQGEKKWNGYGWEEV